MRHSIRLAFAASVLSSPSAFATGIDSTNSVVQTASAALPESGQQRLIPRVPFTRSRFPFDPRIHSGQIVVKFVEGSEQRLRNGVVRLSGGQINARFHSTLAPFGATVQRPFTRSEQALSEEKASGESITGRELADLNLFFYVRPTPFVRPGDVDRLLDLLNALPDVEVAYAEGVSTVARADLAPPTPNYEQYQGYLGPAPYGVDANYAWTVAGGTGLGVRFVDVESGWNFWHEDLKDTDPSIPLPVPPNCPSCDNEHGTSVLGVIIGDRNGFGITGIAYDAGYDVSSSSPSVANAISVSSGALSPGDVILVEQQRSSPLSQSAAGSCVPPGPQYVLVTHEMVEDLVFSAVQTATANQLIVVAAAGNGAVSFDGPEFQGRFDRSSPATFQDSGSIIVGARQQLLPEGVASCFSNFGSRVDASGWGGGVATTGETFSANPDVNQRYTQSFAGTSSAAPMVAGAALAVQGIQRARGGGVIGPEAMRTILSTYGTVEAADNTWRIGRMPDLKAIHTWMLADDDTDGIVNVDEVAGPPPPPPQTSDPLAYLIPVLMLLND